MTVEINTKTHHRIHGYRITAFEYDEIGRLIRSDAGGHDFGKTILKTVALTSTTRIMATITIKKTTEITPNVYDKK